MAQAKDCKTYQAAWTAMGESIVILRDWLLQMDPVTQDFSVRSMLSDLTLSVLSKVEVSAPQDTTAPEKLPHHSNALLGHLTMRLMQLNHQTAFHARQEITAKAMVTPTQMDLVMRDGTAQEVHTQRDLFLM